MLSAEMKEGTEIEIDNDDNSLPTEMPGVSRLRLDTEAHVILIYSKTSPLRYIGGSKMRTVRYGLGNVSGIGFRSL